MGHVACGWWAGSRSLHLAYGRPLNGRRGRQREVVVPTDHRTRHLYGVGSSGAGKSRFCRHLIYQDIRAGRGFTLIDPLDLQREVLAFIAEIALGPGPATDRQIAELGDKLVIIEPTDQRFGVPGINLLEAADGQISYELVDTIIEIVREFWADSYGARMEDLIRNGCLLLAETGNTLLEMLPLLSDASFRQALVGRSRNRELRLYFEGHLGGLRPADLKAWVESTRNRFNAALASPYLRPVFGQSRTTISFREVLDSGKWLIVSLSREKLKESRRLLGAILMALLQNAALTRDRLPPRERYLHIIYADEFQECWTPVFEDILVGARKHSLGLCLFHQNLTQEPLDQRPGIVDTILANAHTRVVFALGRLDAERLAGEIFSPSGAQPQYQRAVLGIPTEQPQFWSLAEEREHYVQQLMHQRTAEAFVSFKGLGDDRPYACRIPSVPDVAIDREKIDALRQHVAARYYRPLADVEREIDDRWRRITATVPAPGRGSQDYST